jgi:hypothetical protein
MQELIIFPGEATFSKVEQVCRQRVPLLPAYTTLLVEVS